MRESKFSGSAPILSLRNNALTTDNLHNSRSGNSVVSRHIFNLLYAILAIFMVFDGIRHFSIVSIYVSPIKEAICLVLFFLILLEKEWLIAKSILKNPMTYFIVYVLLSSGISIYNYDLGGNELSGISGISLLYKTLQIYLLFIIFYYYETVTKNSYLYIIKIFVFMSVIFVLITPLMYFYHFPFMKEFRPWYGRIGSGYPTMDSFTLSVALLLSTFIRLTKSSIINIAINTLLAIGIFIQTTITGFLSLLFLLLFHIFYGHKYAYNNKLNLMSLVMLFFCVTLLLFVITTYYIDDSIALLAIFDNKINFLTTGKDAISVDLRQYQIDLAFSYAKEWYYIVFGAGTNIGAVIESQYYVVLRSFGVIGLVFFCYFLIFAIYKGFSVNTLNGALIVGATGLFIIVSLGLITTYLFSIEAVFCLIYGMFYHNYKKNMNLS